MTEKDLKKAVKSLNLLREKSEEGLGEIKLVGSFEEMKEAFQQGLEDIPPEKEQLLSQREDLADDYKLVASTYQALQEGESQPGKEEKAEKPKPIPKATKKKEPKPEKKEPKAKKEPAPEPPKAEKKPEPPKKARKTKKVEPKRELPKKVKEPKPPVKRRGKPKRGEGKSPDMDKIREVIIRNPDISFQDVLKEAKKMKNKLSVATLRQLMSAVKSTLVIMKKIGKMK